MERIDCMKRVILVVFLVLLFGVPFVSADIGMEFSPEPLHGQLWAFETYLINITGPEVNLSAPEYAELDLSGNLIYNFTIHFKGVGQYHHGTGVTGYSYELSKEYIQQIVPIDEANTVVNVTLEKDAYLYGMKPYEEVQIIFKTDVYLEIIGEGAVTLDPLLESKSRTLLLVDEKKVEYLEDMFIDLQSEVNLTVTASGLEDFNRTKYLGYVESMNNSLAIGDYSEALDVWDSWDRKDRVRMFASFINNVDTQTEELVELQEVEANLEHLQIEYDFLEDKYVAVFKESKLNLEELEATKQGLTTAITGVFLSAIVFFFLGRRTINGDDI